MTTLAALAEFIRGRLPAEIDRLLRQTQADSAGYAALDAAELRPALARSVEAICAAFGADDSAALQGWAPMIGERHARSGLSLADMIGVVTAIRAFCWGELTAFSAGGPELATGETRRFEDALHDFNRLLIAGFSQAMIELQRELGEQAERIAAQQQTIRELSTPILPLYDGILAVPLVGSMDSYRAAQVMERLLTVIAERQSDIVIVDVTGVPIVDTSVANYLLQTARAAQLIGAQVILVGIGAEIAQTIVQLGVDLRGIQIGANLQAGITLALARLGRTIR